MNLEMDMHLIDRIAQGPAWIFWWTRVIDASNWLLLPLAFLDRRAHWGATAWLANIIMILTLYGTLGYVRLLGLSHVIAWTPLLIYLFVQRKPFSEETWVGRYLYWFMAVIGVSLVMDYVEVTRYVLGDRIPGY
ncbi:MAG: hypothetical protein AAFX52_03985 [Pseudomonadota bacterium]